MQVLRLHAPLKDYLWGGVRLKTEFHKETDLPLVAESWEVSRHPDGLTTLSSGETLADYLERQGLKLPFLVKLIDAEKELSLQVHPTADFCKEHPAAEPKTELWYILDAEENAEIIFGLHEGTTAADLVEAAKSNRLLDYVQKVPVKAGDAFLIEAGTVHAIGKGIMLAEVQQNSNTTYRLYDYERLDKNGKPRELHLELGLLAISYAKSPKKVEIEVQNGWRILADTPYFIAAARELDGECTLNSAAYQTLTVLSGTAEIAEGAEKMELRQGDTVFIPANSDITVGGRAHLLLCSPPAKD